MSPLERAQPPPAEQPDEILLHRVAEGDEEAFFTLYRRYANLVYSMARRVLGDEALAEEIVQEVFLKLWQKSLMYDPRRGRFSSWLLSVTRFAAIDRLRYEKRRPREALQDPVPRPAEVRQAQVDHARWQEGQELRLLLAQLPPEQREVVELAYFMGMTHRELAEHLNLPLGTVKSRLRLALEKLRAMWFGDEARTDDPRRNS